ncbi:MAG: DUF3592 domain-containing protein [Cytophagaceae bacterium]
MKKIIYIVLALLAGIILCSIAYREFQREKTLAATGLVVNAEVVENVMHGKFYHPVLAYQYNNVDYKAEAFNSGSSPASYSVGDKVTAYINVENPSEVEIQTVFNQIIKPLILLLFGMLCLFSAFKMLKMKTI